MPGKPFIPTDIDIRLGKLIQINRIKMGMSMKALANKVGVSFQQIQKYESGQNRISVSQLIKIAAALDVSASQLLGEMDKPYATDKKISDLILRIYMMPESKRELIYALADALTNGGRLAKIRGRKKRH